MKSFVSRRKHGARNHLLGAAVVEVLENRTLLAIDAATISANTLTFGGSANNNLITISFNAGSNLYTVSESNGLDIINLFNANNLSTQTATSVTFSGAEVRILNFNGHAGNDTFNILSINGATTIDDDGGSNEIYNVGNSTNGTQGINASLSLNDFPNKADITVNDSADTIPRTFTVNSLAVTGLSPGNISYGAFAVNSLTVIGGSGGNTVPIAGNPGVSTRAITTTVDSGAGNDEVHLTGNTGGANLVIQGHSGLDTVTIGDASHNMQGLIADVYIDNTSGATNLIIDDAGDTTGRIFSINNGLIVGLGSSIGLSPPKITHSLFALNSLTVLGGSGGNTIHVVFNANVSSRAVLTTVNSGAGNDTVSVQSTSGNGGASLLIQGNAGLDTVTINDANQTTH